MVIIFINCLLILYQINFREAWYIITLIHIHVNNFGIELIIKNLINSTIGKCQEQE